MNQLQKADAVFEGGGVRGIGLVGALERAEQSGYQWENIAGTSAGAVVAALVAVGYKAARIKEIIRELEFSSLMDEDWVDRIPLVGHVVSLGLEKGIYEGDVFERLMGKYLEAMGKTTFGDLILDEYKNQPQYRYKLQVIASDVSRGEMLILPRDLEKYGYNPDTFPIAKAVRMSMSIPFFFEPVRLKDTRTSEESYIVDGGLLSNYPVWIFDASGKPEWPTFGFRLVEDIVDPSQPTKLKVKYPIRGPISLFTALFFTAMQAHDLRAIEDHAAVRTISIPTLGIAGTNFNLTDTDREQLYQSGWNAAGQFLGQWQFDEYVKAYRTPAG